MDKLVSLLCVLCFTASCARQYKVEGTTSITQLDGRKLFIRTLLSSGEWMALDSAEIIHGTFSMTGKADSACFVCLFMNDENVLPFVLENGKIKVTIAYDKAEVEGTTMNNILYGFIKEKNELDVKKEELANKEARMVMDGLEIQKIHEKIEKEERLLSDMSDRLVVKFISDNYETILGPNVFMILCGNMPYPMMTPPIEEILSRAPQSFRNNPFVYDFISKAGENMKIIGNTAQ